MLHPHNCHNFQAMHCGCILLISSKRHSCHCYGVAHNAHAQMGGSSHFSSGPRHSCHMLSLLFTTIVVIIQVSILKAGFNGFDISLVPKKRKYFSNSSKIFSKTVCFDFEASLAENVAFFPGPTDTMATSATVTTPRKHKPLLNHLFLLCESIFLSRCKWQMRGL